MRLTIFGIPRTKKNSGRIIPRGNGHIILPSKAWKDWCDGVVPHLRAAMAGRKAIDYPVNCAALFYRDALRGDACGFFQGLADILQHGGVVTDDKWIVQWDGSRLLKDAKSPRVEVVLTAIGAE